MAKNIFFKSEFFGLIKAGKKTSTIRAWKRCLLKEGDIVCVNFDKQFLLQIQEIRRILLSDVSDDIAHADGFDSVTDLKTKLTEIYPGIDLETFALTLIRYTPTTL
jgi:hypothetical protein